MIHFELVFLHGVRWRSNFILFVLHPGIPTPLLEKTVLSPLKVLGTLVKNQLAICGRVSFWALYSIPLVLVLHCFCYSGVTVTFEFRKCDFFNFFYFFVFAIQNPLRFHMNLKISRSVSFCKLQKKKKGCWNFDRDYIKSIDHFG